MGRHPPAVTQAMPRIPGTRESRSFVQPGGSTSTPGSDALPGRWVDGKRDGIGAIESSYVKLQGRGLLRGLSALLISKFSV
jgi:hypothetical protein